LQREFFKVGDLVAYKWPFSNEYAGDPVGVVVEIKNDYDTGEPTWLKIKFPDWTTVQPCDDFMVISEA
jgi:hypothetical protein